MSLIRATQRPTHSSSRPHFKLSTCSSPAHVRFTELSSQRCHAVSDSRRRLRRRLLLFVRISLPRQRVTTASSVIPRQPRQRRRRRRPLWLKGDGHDLYLRTASSQPLCPITGEWSRDSQRSVVLDCHFENLIVHGRMRPSGASLTHARSPSAAHPSVYAPPIVNTRCAEQRVTVWSVSGVVRRRGVEESRVAIVSVAALLLGLVRSARS